MYIHPPSHLDIETPQFIDTPHAWIQWKGTKVCADIHCACGEMSHFDGDFMYFIACPHCDAIWEVGSHVRLYVPHERKSCADPAVQTAEP